MSTPQSAAGDVDELAAGSDLALARSIVYEALAIVLNDPDLVKLDKLYAAETSPALVEAAHILDHADAAAPQADVDSQMRDLAPLVQELSTAVHEQDAGELKDSFSRLFGHTARGRVTAYETEYGAGSSTFRQTQELADISGFYEAFGLKTAENAHQRCDHIVAEYEFMAFLSRKEAYLMEQGHEESLITVRNAQRLFLDEHLGRFGRAFAVSLIKEADNPVHAAPGKLSEAFLMMECRHWGVEPATRFVPLRPDTEDAVPMACGSCELNTGGSQE